ncbi:hypothetical protein SO802_013011 [Lithocarpus litseifolius]|uniref:PGG domain-containing protein n=1 Tax=Lithocarpus litseifolius TaxID=425828 RepID=A0AAW2D825_9ROSI
MHGEISIDYMGKTCSTDPEKGIFQEVPIEDNGKNTEEIISKHRTDLYKYVIEGREDFIVEGDVLREVITSKKNTILHVAAKSGYTKIAQKIINLDPSLLHKRNLRGNTPLHTAASLGNQEMTKLLLSQHTMVPAPLWKITNESHETALHGAVRNGHYKIVVMLIEKDPSLTLLRNKDDESPLFIAVDRGFFDIADHILGIEIEDSSAYGGSKGMNILHAAAIRMDENILFGKGVVSFLKEAHRYLSALRDSFYQTKIPKEILDNGNKLKITKIEFMKKILNKFPKAILEADQFGWTPLHYAARFGNAELVELFLDTEISLAYKQDNEGMCALHISAKHGHVKVMKIFVEKCPYTCELLDNKQRTALHLAAESGNTKAVKIFFIQNRLAFRDLINEQDDKGDTPLHLAAKKGHYALLMSLADVRRIGGTVNHDGKTILDIIEADKLLMDDEKEIIKSNLKRHTIRWSLDKRVGRETTEVQNPITEETSAANSLEENIMRAKENDKKKTNEDKQDDIKDLANFNLLVATIIATVTFAAAFQVPGGNNDGGFAILRDVDTFTNFLIFDSLAFGFSSVSIFANFAYPFIAKATRITYPIMLSLILTELSLVFMVLAFIQGTKSVLTEKAWIPPYVVYASLIPISFFLVRHIIVRKTFLYSDKSRKLPWYL